MTKITSSDCITAIIAAFKLQQGINEEELQPKNWKRTSKKGVDVVIRIFENKVTKTIVQISEINNAIVNILKIDVNEKLIDRLRKIGIVAIEADGADGFTSELGFISELVEHVRNWPKTPVPSEKEAEEMDMDPDDIDPDEDQDIENCEVLHIPTHDNDTLIICAGGDWQAPLTMIIELKFGSLNVTGLTREFKEGMTNDDVLLALYSTTDETEILTKFK